MTDTITLPRSVVEQALKALERADRIAGYKNNWSETVALRAALEQPQVEQEPVAWALFRKDTGEIDWDADYTFSNEPWGVMYDDEEIRPLYLHPQPPRQPLTEEQIRKLIPPWAAWKYEVGHDEAVKFARAIERAHGIGGGA